MPVFVAGLTASMAAGLVLIGVLVAILALYGAYLLYRNRHIIYEMVRVALFPTFYRFVGLIVIPLAIHAPVIFFAVLSLSIIGLLDLALALVGANQLAGIVPGHWSVAHELRQRMMIDAALLGAATVYLLHKALLVLAYPALILGRRPVVTRDPNFGADVQADILGKLSVSPSLAWLTKRIVDPQLHSPVANAVRRPLFLIVPWGVTASLFVVLSTFVGEFLNIAENFRPETFVVFIPGHGIVWEPMWATLDEVARHIRIDALFLLNWIITVGLTMLTEGWDAVWASPAWQGVLIWMDSFDLSAAILHTAGLAVLTTLSLFWAIMQTVLAERSVPKAVRRDLRRRLRTAKREGSVAAALH